MTVQETPTTEGKHTGQKLLRRSRKDRVVAGVAGGLGSYFGIDPIWFRIAFVALTLGEGAGVLLYIIGWIAMPPAAEEGEEPAPARSDGSTGRALAILGAVLIVIGAISLGGQLMPWLPELIWPLALVLIGVFLVTEGVKR